MPSCQRCRMVQGQPQEEQSRNKIGHALPTAERLACCKGKRSAADIMLATSTPFAFGTRVGCLAWGRSGPPALAHCQQRETLRGHATPLDVALRATGARDDVAIRAWPSEPGARDDVALRARRLMWRSEPGDRDEVVLRARRAPRPACNLAPASGQRAA